MGRDSGFIAAYATLANSYVNYCLVPEEKFTLDDNGPRALLPHLANRMEQKHHAVIMVAEGAGQELFENASAQRDASGNLLNKDIGLLLKDNSERPGSRSGCRLLRHARSERGPRRDGRPDRYGYRALGHPFHPCADRTCNPRAEKDQTQ